MDVKITGRDIADIRGTLVEGVFMGLSKGQKVEVVWAGVDRVVVRLVNLTLDELHDLVLFGYAYEAAEIDAL